jgi:preprotein translocase subunit SecA
MSLYKEWTSTTEAQTDASFPDFWKKYCDAEARIYAEILETPDKAVTGTVKELYEHYEVEPILFMGFVDGINDSLTVKIEDLDGLTDDSELDLKIDPEKLYYNMHSAEAEHLYTLSAWEEVLSEEERARIVKEYKSSKTIRKEKTPGRNDPCPCGSGLKYKKCCGKSA